MNKKKTGLFKPEDIDFDTKILDFIIAIADEGGLSKAAEALYLSQPALSRYLKAVETSLGTPIFFRRHQGLALTPARKPFEKSNPKNKIGILPSGFLSRAF